MYMYEVIGMPGLNCLAAT